MATEKAIIAMANVLYSSGMLYSYSTPIEHLRSLVEEMLAASESADKLPEGWTSWERCDVLYPGQPYNLKIDIMRRDGRMVTNVASGEINGWNHKQSPDDIIGWKPT